MKRIRKYLFFLNILLLILNQFINKVYINIKSVFMFISEILISLKIVYIKG